MGSVDNTENVFTLFIPSLHAQTHAYRNTDTLTCTRAHTVTDKSIHTHIHTHIQTHTHYSHPNTPRKVFDIRYIVALVVGVTVDVCPTDTHPSHKRSGHLKWKPTAISLQAVPSYCAHSFSTTKSFSSVRPNGL